MNINSTTVNPTKARYTTDRISPFYYLVNDYLPEEVVFSTNLGLVRFIVSEEFAGNHCLSQYYLNNNSIKIIYSH